MVVVDNAVDDDVVDNDVAGDIIMPSCGSYDHDNCLNNRLYPDRHCDVHRFGSLNRHPCFLLCFPYIKYNINKL